MRAKKAKAIRKSMYSGKAEPTTYEIVLHPFTLVADGKEPIKGAMKTEVSTGKRRMYLIGKKLYWKHGILPKHYKELV